MGIIAVTGTPCTGKTTLAKQLAKQLGYTYVSLLEFARQHKLLEEYDDRRKSWIVDTDKLSQIISKELNMGNYVLDSHLSHYLSSQVVELCVVCTCSDLKKLKRRLEQRGYSKEKVRENLDAEIFKVCLVEVTERHKNIVEIDTCKLTLKEALKRVLKHIKEPSNNVG